MSLGDSRIRHKHQVFAQERPGRKVGGFRQKSGRIENNDVRIGVICSDGTIVWSLTDTEVENERVNRAFERQQRKNDLRKRVFEQTAEIDHW